MELQLIQNKIYEIRGKRVMLDFDLAEMYGMETKRLKEAVRRNIKRFEGEDFMFEPTKEELSRSQIASLNKGRGSNIKYLPFAFTELGVAMLSSVLNSDIAIEINRGIMRAFVLLRQLAMATVELSTIKEQIKRLERADEDNLEAVNDLSEYTRKEIDNLYNAIGALSVKPPQISKPRNPIGFDIDRSK